MFAPIGGCTSLNTSRIDSKNKARPKCPQLPRWSWFESYEHLLRRSFIVALKGFPKKPFKKAATTKQPHVLKAKTPYALATTELSQCSNTPPCDAHPERRKKEFSMRYFLPVALATTVIGLSACSSTTHHTDTRSPGTVLQGRLVGPQQMTLYVFDHDISGSGKSMCNGNCASNWPPLLAPSTAQSIGAWHTITRDDGSKQWSYKGKPLYYWAKDSKPGDTTGDGVGNAWHVANP